MTCETTPPVSRLVSRSVSQSVSQLCDTTSMQPCASSRASNAACTTHRLKPSAHGAHSTHTFFLVSPRSTFLHLEMRSERGCRRSIFGSGSLSSRTSNGGKIIFHGHHGHSGHRDTMYRTSIKNTTCTMHHTHACCPYDMMHHTHCIFDKGTMHRLKPSAHSAHSAHEKFFSPRSSFLRKEKES